MITTYYATIRHHSIARAPRIEIAGSLLTAKREASKKFGMGYLDHEIVIFEETEFGDDLKASRLISEDRWTNYKNGYAM